MNQCEVLVASQLRVMNPLTPEASDTLRDLFTDTGPVLKGRSVWHKENQPQTVDAVRFFAGIKGTLRRFASAGSLDAAVQTLSKSAQERFRLHELKDLVQPREIAPLLCEGLSMVPGMNRERPKESHYTAGLDNRRKIDSE